MKGIPFNRPTLPPWEVVGRAFESFYGTGMLTNGPLVRQLELEARDMLRTGEAVALASCTSGLMLALRCLGVRGKVALPSFTFFATAHAVAWNGLEPVFVDIDPETWNIDPACLERACREEEGIAAALAVHVFGNPCDVVALEELARERGIALVYDSAHALGARVGDSPVGGFGDAEVFSLSPTKLAVAGEGGIVATDNAGLAERLRAARDYGNSGDYDPEVVGLNARMSEFHAALGVESLRLLELNVRRRNLVAERYREGLAGVPGISFQGVADGCRSSYKDVTVLVSEEEFGLSRDGLAAFLAGEGIDTRRYYWPPVHRTRAYWERWGKRYDERLPVTGRVSRNALSLPVWSHMDLGLVDLVCEKVRSAHRGR
jgi:dTDP-4-amino-4,6-dideoxygalactose transaminase